MTLAQVKAVRRRLRAKRKKVKPVPSKEAFGRPTKGRSK